MVNLIRLRGKGKLKKIYNRIIKEQIFNKSDYTFYPSDWDSFLHFALYGEGKIVSVAMLEIISNGNVVVIRHMATDKKYERQGFAKRIIALLEEWSSKQRIKIVKIQAETNAKEFYYQQGYVNYSSLRACLESF